jgi:mono/diheme cytochrome c family protein
LKRKTPSLLYLLAFLICGLQTWSAADAGTINTPPTGGTPPELFQKKCAMCHGTGQGKPAMAKMLHVEPEKMDLTQLKLSDDDIRKTITTGNNKMPAFKSLSDPDLKVLVDYINQLRTSSSNTTATPPKK